jgi:hypothetical protein
MFSFYRLPDYKRLSVCRKDAEGRSWHFSAFRDTHHGAIRDRWIAPPPPSRTVSSLLSESLMRFSSSKMYSCPWSCNRQATHTSRATCPGAAQRGPVSAPVCGDSGPEFRTRRPSRVNR